MIRARLGGAVTVGAAVLLAVASATSAGAVVAPPGSGNNEFPATPEVDAVNRDIPSSMSAARVPSSHVPRPSSLSVAGSLAGTTITGLTMKDQRLADGKNQFSLEPPDQGLCVGGNTVLEAVNDVFRIHTLDGSSKVTSSSEATSLTQFFTEQHQLVRRTETTPAQYGPFLSDPKCYVDPVSGRFFLSMLEIDQNQATGDFEPHTATYLAVSRTADPSTDRSDWYFYTIDTTNDGTPSQSGTGIPGTTDTRVLIGGNVPNHPGCPCLGDQPLIGADKDGFYVTTNEFSLFGPDFNGAQIYALSKSGLESGTMTMQVIDGAPIPLAEGPAYSLQPATSPSQADWATADGGTEYFLSALDFNATLDNRIAQWRLTNTSSLSTSSPDVTLQSPTIISSEVYGQPPAVQQKTGSTPLADAVKERENLLNANDDRMNQVVLQGGTLWGAVNTVVKTQNGPTASGIAWFAVNAQEATIAKQGYVAVNNQSVLFPSIAMNPQGKGVMTFSLSGRDYYPSSAYVRIDLSGVSGPVRVMGWGQLPADGFTGYQAYGGTGVERWGDYSAAVPDQNGDIWVAAEDIPGSYGFNDTFVDANGTTQSFLANWGTTIARVTP